MVYDSPMPTQPIAPPERTGGRPPSDRWMAVAKACRENPGRWHYLGRQYVAYRRQIKTGRIVAFRPAGTFDAMIRNGDTTKGDLYVTFIPREQD